MRELLRWLVLGWCATAWVWAADPAAPRRVALGPATLSLPADWAGTAERGAVPIWIHLHGATDVVEREFAAIGSPGVLVTLSLPGLSRVYGEHFATPAVLPELIGEIERALRAEAAGEWKAGRLTVSSFSAGFGGVRELLRQPDNEARIAALVMADSIYCGYAGDAPARRVDPELMAGFARFAQAAAEGRKRMVISHSAQVPEGYASTTETADYLLARVNGERAATDDEWPAGGRLQSRFARGHLEILGFAGERPEDHLWHLRSIGGLLERVAPAVARSARTVEELRGQLGRHLAQERFRGAIWGVKVLSLASGQTWFEHAPARLLSPASNAKLYTGALALDRLGGDYRIVTPILATAKPDAAGNVAGDLVIAGRADPSWNSGPGRAGFDAVLASLVNLIAGAGVKRVAGDLVADATFLRGSPSGAGWTADDLNDDYGAELSALTLEDNYADLRIAPGAEVGAPASVAWVQPHTGLALDNRVVTVAAGAARRVEVRRPIGERVVYLFGQIPVGAPAALEQATVPRPAQWLADALKAALAARGIAVAGRARSVRWPEAAPDAAKLVPLGEILSPQMHELVTAFMKPSQNLQTDLIFGYLGEKERTDEVPAWRTSEELGVTSLRQFLQENRLYPLDVRVEEGSGLSRNNLTSARATVALLTFMAQHREAEAFRAALPIAGVDGTLRRRMKGTAAEGNVRAKTGTLRWANSLAGYVTTAAGEPLAFCVMLNRAVVTPGRSARDDIDAIPEMLARFSGPKADAAAAR
jgi:D-alanyl-D-alanine carboxypeptidase/D-alanyl-D-alanine-endopeptidase (penicillin-binding protein 4)